MGRIGDVAVEPIRFPRRRRLEGSSMTGIQIERTLYRITRRPAFAGYPPVAPGLERPDVLKLVSAKAFQPIVEPRFHNLFAEVLARRVSEVNGAKLLSWTAPTAVIPGAEYQV